jgi:hypothetical protein
MERAREVSPGPFEPLCCLASDYVRGEVDGAWRPVRASGHEQQQQRHR